MKFGWPLFITSLCLIIFISACRRFQSPETLPVSGVVTLQGEPVSGAQVTLVPDDPQGTSASAITDAAGQFSIRTVLDPENQPNGAFKGEYRITVSKFEAAEVIPGHLSNEELEDALQTTPAPKPLLPVRYLDPKTSGLRLSLTAPVKTPLKLELSE